MNGRLGWVRNNKWTNSTDVRIFQPMVDYVVAKENTGVYHNRRSVHMPVDVELQQRNTERLVFVLFICAQNFSKI